MTISVERAFFPAELKKSPDVVEMSPVLWSRRNAEFEEIAQ